ncbi:M3 family metallopeptidase [Altericroceibacterium endophyticum]|uniref:Dipeptidyl carboxypeptidase n=1 Tax=Altericroceibacterium endophyticum TaxID=1808508 RepID=A0A6I4T5Y2_9SPHN|nr:M3 family metallopeptidase [Altericroceibacterium endophyticum]MXO66078.1 dipeptidyl carboxypeptidase II [Altericroceibacterium endophyticum]
MRMQLLTTSALGLLLSACTTMGETAMNDPVSGPSAESTIPEATGIFAQPSTLPFHAPDFNAIQDGDYLPAIEQGMAIHSAEVQAIIDNPQAPTFSNTIVALDQSGQMLSRVLAVFWAVTGANTNDTLDAVDAEISPKLTAHQDAIALNPDLFARVKAVYDQRAVMSMTPEDAALLEKTYQDMVHAGAMLTAEQKAQVKELNTQLSTLTTEFSQTLTEATKAGALVLDSKDQLAGLKDSEIEAAAQAAKDRGMPGKYVITLQNTTQQPDLATLENRDVREALFNASWTRAEKGDENDTRALIVKIAQLRAQKAALFGESDWASYVMYDRMAKTPKTALDFMEQMVPALAATQRREAAMLNEAIAEDGKDFSVEPWDWQMYAEKVRKARYDIDEEEVKPYFEIRNVLENGVFYAANQLYGLTFKQRTDIPVYHDDVWTYTVYDKDGSELGLFYFDPYKRDNKRGGAWMSNFVEQSSLTGNKPVIYNVLNIPKAPAGEPQLVSFDNVETMFHEFGHALHGFFADQKYLSLSGTNVARDFVEYPSQVNEMWASDPKILAHYAKHYQTGKAIPTELIDKIDAASKFNQGYSLGETVEAALLDMKWHSLSMGETQGLDADAFEAKALSELGMETDLVPPRYRSSYFRHIFTNGYAAGYYSYLWTQMLDKDSREWFEQNGGATRANGDHFRESVLSQGGTKDYLPMYRAFTGHDPQVDPMLRAAGLIEEEAD